MIWMWRIKKWLRRRGVLECQCTPPKSDEPLADWERELLFPCVFCGRQS